MAITYPDKNTGDQFTADEATEVKSEVNALIATVAGKAETAHTHALAAVTDAASAGSGDVYRQALVAVLAAADASTDALRALVVDTLEAIAADATDGAAFGEAAATALLLIADARAQIEAMGGLSSIAAATGIGQLAASVSDGEREVEWQDAVPIEFADGAAVITGTAADKIMSPLSLTDAIADGATIIAGTSGTRPVTAATLTAAIADSAAIIAGTSGTRPVSAATLTAALATATQIVAGTSGTRPVTAASLATANAWAAATVTTNQITAFPAGSLSAQASITAALTITSGVFGNIVTDHPHRLWIFQDATGREITWGSGVTVANAPGTYANADTCQMFTLQRGPSDELIAAYAGEFAT